MSEAEKQSLIGNSASSLAKVSREDIIELTDAERFYIQDDAAYVDALYAYSVAKAKLDRATGASLTTIAR